MFKLLTFGGNASDLLLQIVHLSLQRLEVCAPGRAREGQDGSAQQAQNRADAAASAAQAAQQSCDAVNDKIDRMFKKSLSK
jgi:hypothetical protein